LPNIDSLSMDILFHEKSKKWGMNIKIPEKNKGKMNFLPKNRKIWLT